MRLLLAILILAVPWPVRRWILNTKGHRIDRTAKIGLSVIMVGKLIMGPNSRIGHFNVIKGVDLVDLGEWSKIGNLNWIGGLRTGDPKHFTEELNRTPIIRMNQYSSITSRHYIDCSNRVEFGAYSILAGANSQIMSHAIDIASNRQMSGPVTIGECCFIGTSCVLLKGATLPNYSVLGANSTLHRTFTDTHTLYSGVPAAAVKALDPNSAFFKRKVGFVS